MKKILFIVYFTMIFINDVVSQNCLITINSGFPILNSPLCGESNGSIEIKALSINGVVKYTLNGGVTNSTGLFTNLSPGNYNVVISDQQNCKLEFSTELENSSEIGIVSIETQNSSCETNTGEILINAIGENLKYKLNNGSFQTSNVFSELPSGNYKVSIVNTSNCEIFENVSVGKGNININKIETRASFCGFSEGEIEIFVTNPSDEIEYKIKGITQWQTNSVFRYLEPAKYTVEIKDGAGCLVTRNVTVSQILNFTINSKNSTCDMNDGEITINVQTSGDFEYSIDAGQTYQKHNNFTSLSPRNYPIRIRDINNGCVKNTSKRITESNGIIVNDVKSRNTNCGLDNGSITVESSNTNYNYQLRLNNQVLISNDTGIFENLGPATYVVTILNQTSCTRNVNKTIVEINDIILTSNDVVISASECQENTGQITVNARSSENNVLTFQLDNQPVQNSNKFINVSSGEHMLTIFSSTGCKLIRNLVVPEINDISISHIDSRPPTTSCSNNGFIEIQASGTNIEYSLDQRNYQKVGLFQNLTYGDYIIYIRNSNGCEKRSGLINLPTQFKIDSLNITDDTCEKGLGSVEIYASGENLTFSLDGNTYQNTPFFDGLITRDYTAFVKQDGCVIEKKFSVKSKFEIKVKDLITKVDQCKSNSGEIMVTLTIITDGLEYSIDGTNFQKENTFYNLPSGSGTVYIRNEFDCFESFEFDIAKTYEIDFDKIEVNNDVCKTNSGEIIVNVTSSSKELKYSLDGVTYKEGKEFLNLESGMYNVFVKNEFDCIISEQVEIKPTYEFNIELIEISTTFCGDDNGTLFVTTSPLVNPSILLYSIDGITYQTSNEFLNLKSGDYSVFVKNNFDCVKSEKVKINESYSILVSSEIKNSVCESSNGEIIFNATGGVGILEYSVNGSSFQTNSVFSNLSSGIYSYAIKDEVNCLITGNVELPSDCLALLPSAISPNGNGINDELRIIYPLEIQINKYEIFDRWGKLIYSQKNQTSSQIDWFSGQGFTIGNYLYKISFIENDIVQNRSGSFLIIK